MTQIVADTKYWESQTAIDMPLDFGRETASDYTVMRFDARRMMLDTPRKALAIEERIILEDQALMSQIRPAMESLENGTFFQKLIAWIPVNKSK